MLTQARLKELFDYNPDTGIFTRLVDVRPAKAGVVAGCLDPSGYLRVNVDRKLYWMHRLAWLYVNGVMPTHVIDHINRDKADNRIANLRDASYGDNNRNTGLKSTNKSGVIGVSWSKGMCKWEVNARRDGVKKRLGYVDHLFEAACLRKSWEAANPVFA